VKISEPTRTTADTVFPYLFIFLNNRVFLPLDKGRWPRFLTWTEGLKVGQTHTFILWHKFHECPLIF